MEKFEIQNHCHGDYDQEQQEFLEENHLIWFNYRPDKETSENCNDLTYSKEELKKFKQIAKQKIKEHNLYVYSNAHDNDGTLTPIPNTKIGEVIAVKQGKMLVAFTNENFYSQLKFISDMFELDSTKTGHVNPFTQSVEIVDVHHMILKSLDFFIVV
jgi:hypothetical protein